MSMEFFSTGFLSSSFHNLLHQDNLTKKLGNFGNRQFFVYKQDVKEKMGQKIILGHIFFIVNNLS